MPNDNEPMEWEEFEAQAEPHPTSPEPDFANTPPPHPTFPLAPAFFWLWNGLEWTTVYAPHINPIPAGNSHPNLPTPEGFGWCWNGHKWGWRPIAFQAFGDDITHAPPPPVATPPAFNAWTVSDIQPSELDFNHIMKRVTKRKAKTGLGALEDAEPKQVEKSDETPDRHIDGSKPKNWGTMISFCGGVWPGSTPNHWEFFKDVGWVHENERSDFFDLYKKCMLTDKYYANSLILRTSNCPSTGNRRYVNVEAAGKAKWLKCASSNFMGPPEEFVKAFNVNDSIVHIHVSQEGSIRKCDFNGKYYLTNAILAIKGNETYKRISCAAFNESGQFGKCPACASYFFKADLVSGVGDYAGQLICLDCCNKIKYAHAIGPWNHKTYPEPIYTKEYRMGSTVAGGLVYATNKQVPVKNPRLLGVEAEVELYMKGVKALKLNRFDMAVRVKEVLGSDFVVCKEDGTLTMNGKYNGDLAFDPKNEKNGKMYAGFEIVTCPCDITTQRERWTRLANHKKLHDDKGNSLLWAWDTDTCGFHVHVSKDALTTLQIGRMLRFINHPKNGKFIHKIAGRGSDVFCKYHEKEIADARHPEKVVSLEEQGAYNRARRVALNVSNEHTIEFRIFRGTIHPNHIMRNLMFVEATCDFCYPASRAMSDMDNYDAFIYYVSKNVKKYPELAAWFVKQKQISIGKIKEGVDISKLTIHPDMVAEPEVVKIDKPPQAHAMAQPAISVNQFVWTDSVAQAVHQDDDV